MAVTLDEGDELAAAWEQVRQLGEQLEVLKAAERSARRDDAAAREQLEAQERRFGWLRAEHDDVRSRPGTPSRRNRSALAHQLANAVQENGALCDELELLNAAPRAEASPPPPMANRAQRRRAARDAAPRS